MDDLAVGVAADEQSPTVWEKHPAWRVLYNLYREQDCPGTVDALDPQDCAGVAAESVRVLMETGWLAAESDYQFVAVVDKRSSGGEFEMARVRDTLGRAESDGAMLALTGTDPVMVMKRRRSGGDWVQLAVSEADWHPLAVKELP